LCQMQNKNRLINSNVRFYFLLIAILLFGFFIRIIDIEINPPGLFSDEASIGYNAYSILKKGIDEHGRSFPIFFEAFGDYRTPIPIYSQIPAIGLFGLNIFSIRLTSVIFSLINIILITLIAKNLTNSNNAGIIAGLFMAIIPWSVHMSRWGMEQIYLPTVLSAAIYVFLLGLKKPILFIPAFILLGLTTYTYLPSLLLIPFLLIFITLYLLINKSFLGKRKYVIFGLFFFIAICLPIIGAYRNNTLLTRWQSVQEPNLTYSEKVKKMAFTYASHFMPDFLFLKGDSFMPGHFITRHSVKGYGELYLFQAPLIVIGLIYIFLRRRNFGNIIMLLLFFLYPLGSVFAHEGAVATRSIAGIVPLVYFSSLGGYILMNKIGRLFGLPAKKIILLLIVSVSFIFTFNYLNDFYRQYPMYSADF